MKKTTAKQPEQVLVNKDSLESMADNIKAISKALQGKWGGEGQLNEDTLITLIYRQVSTSVNRHQIGIVLNAVRKLEKSCLVQPKK